MLVLGIAQRQVGVGLAGLVVNVAGNLLLVPTYGFMAAAWMTLATEVVVVGGCGYLAVRELGGWHAVSLGRLPRVVAAAAVLLAVLIALEAVGSGLVVLAVVTGVLYPALLIGLRAVAPQELRVLLLKRGDGVVEEAQA
jgi:O-antigen/teichoic acid export membrane protein